MMEKVIVSALISVQMFPPREPVEDIEEEEDEDPSATNDDDVQLKKSTTLLQKTMTMCGYSCGLALRSRLRVKRLDHSMLAFAGREIKN